MFMKFTILVPSLFVILSFEDCKGNLSYFTLGSLAPFVSLSETNTFFGFNCVVLFHLFWKTTTWA